MKTECLKIVAWLEESECVPETALEDIADVQTNVADSIQDFIAGVDELLEFDWESPEIFGSRLMMIKGRAQDLRNDIQDIEDALRKTTVVLPDDRHHPISYTTEG